jgi:hypothetical protein
MEDGSCAFRPVKHALAPTTSGAKLAQKVAKAASKSQDVNLQSWRAGG